MGLHEKELLRMRETLAARINNEDEIVIAASEERSQKTNLDRAYARMESLIVNAARLPRIRHATKPSKAAREKRLELKRQRSKIKAGRRYKPEE